MPTYDADRRFLADFDRLTVSDKQAFLAAIEKLVADFRTGGSVKGLGVKRVRARPGVWEPTWADDGRATFEYGASLRPGGSHDILQNP